MSGSSNTKKRTSWVHKFFRLETNSDKQERFQIFHLQLFSLFTGMYKVPLNLKNKNIFTTSPLQRYTFPPCFTTALNLQFKFTCNTPPPRIIDYLSKLPVIWQNIRNPVFTIFLNIWCKDQILSRRPNFGSGKTLLMSFINS